MSRKAKVYIACVAVTLAGVIPASFLSLSAGQAGASTATCGSACTSPTVLSLGTSYALTASGTSVVLAAASTSNSNQDWTPENFGTVGQPGPGVTAGLVSPRLALTYSNAQLVEFQFAPNGDPSDTCLADSAALQTSSNLPNYGWYLPTFNVGLAQCGVSAATLWAEDVPGNGSGYLDLISVGYTVPDTYDVYNGTGAAAPQPVGPFAEPFVLTAGSTASNGDYPVSLVALKEIGGTFVDPSQMWASYVSPAQAAARAKAAKHS